uniref:Uncharacterized protein n=1 Tax=Arundo donax TaxID=35708 RepID=A0A0A8XYS7_ARUDO
MLIMCTHSSGSNESWFAMDISRLLTISESVPSIAVSRSLSFCLRSLGSSVTHEGFTGDPLPLVDPEWLSS